MHYTLYIFPLLCIIHVHLLPCMGMCITCTMYECMHVYMYVCIYVYTYVCMYLHVLLRVIMFTSLHEPEHSCSGS